MISKFQPTRTGTPQVQSILITAITLFALSGLMVGFTVGALVHTPKPSTNNTNQTNLGNHATPTPKSTPLPTAPPFVHLGPPSLTFPSPTLNPDGTQTYSVTLQAKDNGNGGKPPTADGISCRIWLVPQGSDPQNDPGTHFQSDTAQLQHPETFNQPFPQELPNTLLFDPTTPSQTQPCVQGSANWKFTTSPALPKANYYLVALTDWQGKSYNWVWVGIVIGDKKQGA